MSFVFPVPNRFSPGFSTKRPASVSQLLSLRRLLSTLARQSSTDLVYAGSPACAGSCVGAGDGACATAIAGNTTPAANAIAESFMSVTPLLTFTYFRRSAEELAEQPMEMVHALLAGRRIPSARIEARAHAPLHRLHDRLILGLDAVERGARARLELRRLPHVRAEEDHGAVDRLRLHEVQRQAPRVEVEHQV